MNVKTLPLYSSCVNVASLRLGLVHDSYHAIEPPGFNTLC
jgi:hypothetical protein